MKGPLVLFGTTLALLVTANDVSAAGKKSLLNMHPGNATEITVKWLDDLTPNGIKELDSVRARAAVFVDQRVGVINENSAMFLSHHDTTLPVFNKAEAILRETDQGLVAEGVERIAYKLPESRTKPKETKLDTGAEHSYIDDTVYASDAAILRVFESLAGKIELHQSFSVRSLNEGVYRVTDKNAIVTIVGKEKRYFISNIVEDSRTLKELKLSVDLGDRVGSKRFKLDDEVFTQDLDGKLTKVKVEGDIIDHKFSSSGSSFTVLTSSGQELTYNVKPTEAWEKEKHGQFKLQFASIKNNMQALANAKAEREFIAARAKVKKIATRKALGQGAEEASATAAGSASTAVGAAK